MGAGAGAAALTGLRLVVIVIALAVVGLGAWAKVLIHDIEVRGSAVLDTIPLSPEQQDGWRGFFDAVVNSQTRIWVAIAAGCFVTLATTLILVSHFAERMRMSTYLLLPLELVAMLAMAAGFGATLSLAMKLIALQTPALDSKPSPDLNAFSVLFPLSKGYAIAAGTGMFTLLMTSMSAVIQACHRARDSKACSFEPTASSLGMGHGYQAVAPRKSRGPIPTLYDPLKPIPQDQAQIGDEEKGFAIAGADMGRRDSGQNGVTRGSNEISGPLDLQVPENVAQMRPARPWSEMPKRR